MAERISTEFQRGEEARAGGQLQVALASFAAAAEGCEILGIPYQRAVSLNECGRVLRHLDRAGEAIESLQEAEAVFEELPRPSGATEKLDRARCIVLHNLGGALREANRPEEALAPLERALEIAEALSDPLRLADVLNGIGAVYRDLRLRGEAEALFARARDEAAGDLPREAQALNNLGAMAHDRGDHRAALEWIQAARERYEEAGDSRLATIARTNAARQLIDLGEPESARAELMLAASAPGVGERVSLSAPIHSNLARIEELSGDLSGALEMYEKARELYEQVGDVGRASTVVGMTASIHLRTGNQEAGLRLIRESIDRMEETGDAILSSDLRSELQANASDLYAVQVEAELALTGEEVAFATAERAKARALLLTLAAAPASSRPDRSNPEIDRFLEALGSEDGPTLLELARASLAYRRLDRRGDMGKAEEFELDALQAVLADLDADLISFVTSETICVAFVVTAGGVSHHRLPGLRVIEDAVRRLREEIATDEFDAATASELYGYLFAAASEKLSRPELVIVPDGPLHQLPFAALVTRPVDDPVGSPVSSYPFLIREKRLRVIPSAPVLSELQARSATDARSASSKRIAAVAGPDHDASREARRIRAGAAGKLRPLEGAEKEVALIAALAQADGVACEMELLQGREATWSAVQELLRADFDIVHFACHGEANADVPWLSGLQLVSEARDSTATVRAYELQDLELNSPLVVLSACESGFGRILRGEGLLGLTTSFFRAGASTLCVSLWPIFDELTPGIMDSFYSALLDGASAAEALQHAQLGALASGQDSPAVWAPFVVVGPG